MAEVYGAKYVLLLSVAGSAIINMATPWMARTSLGLLVFSRVVMGAIQAGVFPGMYALFSKWLTMSEASIYAPLIKMNLRLGMLLGSLVPGIISGWPNVFYFTGLISTVWSILWFLLATSSPQENRWVSQAELEHIMRKKKRPPVEEEEAVEMSEMDSGQAKDERKKANIKTKRASLKTPWLKIITASPVIGLILVKLTFNYALDFLAIELPSYLKYVHHSSRQTVSLTSGQPRSLSLKIISFH